MLNRFLFGVGTSLLLLVASPTMYGQAGVVAVDPAKMARVGTVDERFQSYNIEMVEVTGGRFWKPYASKSDTGKGAGGNQPAGMNPNLYEYRPPKDLSNARLRKLAAALGPVYLRVSGTWANSTYFQTGGGKAGETPKGFNGVLTADEWKGVIDFAHAVHAEIVTSFATSGGTRDAVGVWTPAEAEKFVRFTKAAGGRIAAAEFMNEPTFAEMGGAPKGYNAAAYAKDLSVFLKFAKKDVPGMLTLGPGGVGEGTRLVPASMHLVSTEDIMKATGPVFDVFSYHSYGGVSSRCGAMGAGSTTTTDAALSEDWLKRADQTELFYAALRDRFEPGKPIWLTETAEAACGGDRWASALLDSFRYLDQLGDLAKRGVKVQMHNTLAASDYGLLDENTYAPRPNYWAAVLWSRLMGATVLDAGNGVAGLHVYAHCLHGSKGGVALLAINLSQTGPQELNVAGDAERYTLTAHDLLGTAVQLNGKSLELGGDDSLPAIEGEMVKAGAVSLAPASITFLAFPKARNSSCE